MAYGCFGQLFQLRKDEAEEHYSCVAAKEDEFGKPVFIKYFYSHNQKSKHFVILLILLFSKLKIALNISVLANPQRPLIKKAHTVAIIHHIISAAPMYKKLRICMPVLYHTDMTHMRSLFNFFYHTTFSKGDLV